MLYKHWISMFFIPVVIGIFFIASFNYMMDPLWTFSHTNKFNQIQNDFDERQQKTNFIYFNQLDNFDGLLLGSSRSTFINQNDFNDMNIYNYAVNSMIPSEYIKYISFAKQNNKNDFKYIIIGADFYGSNKIQESTFKKPEFYINNTQEKMYRYKLLLSMDNFKQARKNYANNASNTTRYYTRKNIKEQKKISEEERKLRYTISLQNHLNTFKDKNYQYDTNYINILQEMKKINPHAKFIIFTSPITSNLLKSILKNKNRFKDYQRWLKEILSVFGEIHHFMSINRITDNLQNYTDDDHYYPHIAKILANKISNKEYTADDNFGFILNEDNIDGYLEKLHKEINKK